jgi:hypothetical protein
MPAEDLAEEYERRHKEQARRQKMQVEECMIKYDQAYFRGFYDSHCHFIAIPVVVIIIGETLLRLEALLILRRIRTER